MRVYIDIGYSARGVAEVTPTELETFCRVLDKVQCSGSWYGGSDRVIELNAGDDARVDYTVRMVPASVRVDVPAPTAAEEN